MSLSKTGGNGAYLGTRGVRRSLALEPNGGDWSGDFPATIAGPSGAVIQTLNGRVSASRIAVESATSPASAIAAATPVSSGRPNARDTVEVTGLVAKPLRLTVADLKALPARSVDVSWMGDTGERHHHTFRGVPLPLVLQAAAPRFGSDRDAHARSD